MDAGHEWTDEEIEKLSRAFAREYRQAEREMRQKLSTLMADYNEKNNDWLRKLADGTAEREDYEAWLHKMANDKAFMGGLADTLARDAVDADKRAMELINDAVPTVYAENANRAAYEIDSTLGRDHSFDLYDQSTVRKLLTEPENAIRIPQPSIDGKKDLRWNKQKFTSAITQSVLQGESVPNAAKRLANVLGMDSRALMMSARTALTGAENAGRVDSYRRAEALGIRLEQQWMATLDERTRESHRELDGQHVPVGEKFEVDGEEIEFPGDPSAPPELVCNCRCTLVAWFPNIEQKDPERWSRLPDGMTYDKWKTGKELARIEESRLLSVEETHRRINALEGIDFLGRPVSSTPDNPSRLAKTPIKYVGTEQSAEVMQRFEEAKASDSPRALQEVKVDELLSTQAGLYRKNLHEILDSESAEITVFTSLVGDVDYIELLEIDGNLYIIDGNHRCAIAMMRGRKSLLAMVRKA